MKTHKVLFVFSVITILGICSFTMVFLVNNTGILAGNSVLDVEGNNWDLEIKSNNDSIKIKNTDINVSGKIEANNSLEYDITIKNKGSIDAYLYSIINTGNEKVNVKYLRGDKELETGFVLKRGEEVNLKLVLEAIENAEFNIDSGLIFNQYNTEVK